MKKIILTLLIFYPLLATAQTAEEKGLEIVSKAIEADRGFGSSTVDLKMILKNKNSEDHCQQVNL